MDLQLDGKIAVVTDASRGIGLAITRALVREGATVVAGARTSSAELDELVSGAGVTFIPVDLGRPEAAATLVDAAGGRIDVLVNNVGHAPARTGGFLAITDEQWQQSLELNLLSMNFGVGPGGLKLPLVGRIGSPKIDTVLAIEPHVSAEAETVSPGSANR